MSHQLKSFPKLLQDVLSLTGKSASLLVLRRVPLARALTRQCLVHAMQTLAAQSDCQCHPTQPSFGSGDSAVSATPPLVDPSHPALDLGGNV